MNMKINIFKFLYIVAYVFILVSSMMSNVYFLQQYVNYFEWIGYIILFFVFMSNYKYSKKSIIFYILSFFCVIVSTIVSGNMTILRLFIILIVINKFDFKNLIKIDFVVRFIILLLVIFLYKINLTENFDIYKEGRIRYSLGFLHPNILGYMVMILNIEYVYLYGLKFNIKQIIIFFISIGIMYFLAYSRTCTIILLAFYALMCIPKKYKESIFKNKKLCWIFSNIFVILTLITIIMYILYVNNTQIGIFLDKLSSHRLICIQNFMNEYSITLFGNKLDMITPEESRILNVGTRVIDNAYMHIILRYGLIIYVILAYLFKMSIKNAIKNKDYFIFLIFILFIIYGFSETYLFMIDYNVFLMYFSKIIFKKSEA